MPKIVVNDCFGGFGLSHDAIMRYGEIANLNLKYVKGESEWDDSYYKHGIEDPQNLFYEMDIDRADPILVQVVEELGKRANDSYANLRIANVPNDVKWYIDDYDGIETVREEHRTW